jgi:hypothetical protein
MLETIVERLTDLLEQGRIEHADLEALVGQCARLTDAELGALILRLDAVHRLLTALQQRRLAQTGGR